MVATFRSLVQPLILLVSIPFAATGAIGLLLATGTPLGVPALIGVLMLVGIVVTNAIVLMDLINQYRRAGHGRAGGGGRGRPAPAAADPDDRDRDHLRAAADGARPDRRGRLHLPAAGHRGHRRPGQLDAADAGAGADALHDGGEPQGEVAGQARSGAGLRKAGARTCPKHAAEEPDADGRADDAVSPDSSGGAHEAPKAEPARSRRRARPASRCAARLHRPVRGPEDAAAPAAPPA